MEMQNAPERHELFLDLFAELSMRCPTLPSGKHGRTFTFKGVLANSPQDKFESIGAGDANIPPKQKAQDMALMKLIGGLFSKGLLKVKIVLSIFDVLLSYPTEHGGEYAIELL